MHRILLVDPNDQSREATIRMLDWARHGFVLQHAVDNAPDTLALIEAQPISLVLINIKRLHGCSLDICSTIRQSSDVPIILLGGGHDFNLARKALTLRVKDYLPDPVQTDELAACLESLRCELDGPSPLVSDLFAAADLRWKRQPKESIVDLIKQFVQSELHQDVSLKKIAEILHFNCAYLGQKFKQEEKISFNEYLLQQRMERAMQLLENTDLRVYEIAGEVGYTEIDWFYRKFREYAGTSANEYRKRISVIA